MQQVSLPKTFFIKERNHVYSDWRTAFWREMFQNAGDAICRNVQISTEVIDGNLFVEFADDGHGMDEKTIREVFFALGQTTKDNEDGVGGFGRARILTCFSMDSYEFWSKHNHCKGDGAMYEINTVPDFHNGCRFRINLGNENENEMMSSLSAVLQRSQLPYKVFVNGDQFLGWMQKQRHIKDETFGAIHVNKSRQSGGEVVVRVKGLWTFSIKTSASPQIVIEINSKRCRDILTVNRDGMHWAYQSSLQKFLEALAIDKRSALRENKRKTRLIEGTGIHTTTSKKSDDILLAEEQRSAPEAPIGGGIAAAVALTSAMDEIVEREIISGDQYQTNLPTIYLNDETDATDVSHRKVRRRIEEYDPTNWKFFTKKRAANDDGVETFRKGGSKLKLLIAWETCCREAIRAFMAARNEANLSWMVGWMFSFDAHACHEDLGVGHALCLNPVNDDGTMRYKLRDKGDQKRLMALAKHEVAHVLCKYHDEDFSSLHTDIDALFDEASCYRDIRSSLKTA